MCDDSPMRIRATFETQEAADLAVEHLVQQHGISRSDIFIPAASSDNTSGSGGDVSHDEGARRDAPLKGEIEVSADPAPAQIAAVQRSFGYVGATLVSGR